MTGTGDEQEWDAFPPGTYGGPPQSVEPSVYAGPRTDRRSPTVRPPTVRRLRSACSRLPTVSHTRTGRLRVRRAPNYGPPPGWGWPLDTTWPYGPDRPSQATAAAVLGFVTAGLTVIVDLFVLADVAGGTADVPQKMFLFGFLSAVALVIGGVRLLQGWSSDVLFGAALASVTILLVALLTGVATLYSDQVAGLAVIVVLALPLPVLTAVFSRMKRVRGWTAAGPASLFDPI